MEAHRVVLGSVVFFAATGLALAQTPTPVDSNVAVTPFAQGNCPTPGSTPGADGCGGCYPQGLPPSNPILAALAQLSLVDPEWAAIGTMISGEDSSVPPASSPVLIHGTVALSKINEGGDFPGSHLTDDQNTFITVDPEDNGRLATGNDPAGCSGEGCNQVEMELESGKYPLFAWADTADRVTALGRWIFDCGHPDPSPGHCSLTIATSCVFDSDCPAGQTCVGGAGACAGPNVNGNRCLVDADCATCTSGTCSSGACTNNNSNTCTSNADCPSVCSNNISQTCAINSDCGATCSNPVPTFNYRAEMHPPQAIVVQRMASKSVGVHPATQADVYISGDAGGAGNSCTVTHLASPASVLLSKSCFAHHCSVTTARSCASDHDCANGETCETFDPTSQPLANINASDFEFDVPLPTPPPSGTPQLLISTKKFKPPGGQMPKPTFEVTPGPTPNLHVVVPMADRLPNGQMPNVFAERILARWKGDQTQLTHVQVKFKSLTINNPLKATVPAFARQCTKPNLAGLSGTSCATDKNCTAGTCSVTTSRHCYTDSQCPKTEHCTGQSRCVGGLIPGWNMYGEVNGDWVQFKALTTLGAKKPFATPPFVLPSPTPLVIPEHFTFNEYVPSNSTIHIMTTGQSLNCLDILYGKNLIQNLDEYGIGAGAACLAAGDLNPSPVDLTLSGSGFTTPSQGTCTAGVKPTDPYVCTVSPTGSDGGTCSVTTNRLCVDDSDCTSVGTCSSTSASCHRDSDCLHCSNNSSTACTVAAQTTDCGMGNTCDAGGQTCTGGDSCQTGGAAFTLTYTVQVK